MKIYKRYLFLILGILMWGTTGCVNGQIEDQSNAISNDSKNLEIKATNESGDIYNNIINQYIDAIDNDFFKDVLSDQSEDWDLIGKDVNTNLLSNSRDYKQYKVYYALQDMDNNGNPELFIGGSDGNTPPLIYDLFIFNQEKVVNPFTELGYEFGHRTHLDFYSDGVFEVDWSNSGMNNGMNFYRITADGYSIELIESISLNKSPHDVLKYYHDTEGTAEISKEEFNSILQRFRDVGKEKLLWIEINR